MSDPAHESARLTARHNLDFVEALIAENEILREQIEAQNPALSTFLVERRPGPTRDGDIVSVVLVARDWVDATRRCGMDPSQVDVTWLGEAQTTATRGDLLAVERRDESRPVTAYFEPWKEESSHAA